MVVAAFFCLSQTKPGCLSGVPEGHQILAGGDAAEPPDPATNAVRPRGGARSTPVVSRAPSGAHSVFTEIRGLRSRLAPPPANIWCPSGTGRQTSKRSLRTRVSQPLSSVMCFINAETQRVLIRTTIQQGKFGGSKSLRSLRLCVSALKNKIARMRKTDRP